MAHRAGGPAAGYGPAAPPSQQHSVYHHLLQRAPRPAYPLDDRDDDDDSDSVQTANSGGGYSQAPLAQHYTHSPPMHYVPDGRPSPVPGLPLAATVGHAPPPFSVAAPPPTAAHLACLPPPAQFSLGVHQGSHGQLQPQPALPPPPVAAPPSFCSPRYTASGIGGSAPFLSARDGVALYGALPHRPRAPSGRGGGSLIGLSSGGGHGVPLTFHGSSRGAPYQSQQLSRHTHWHHPNIGYPVTHGTSGGGGGPRCTSDDTLEGLSLVFLAACRPTFALLAQCAVFSAHVFLLRDRAAWASSAAAVAAWAPAVDAASLASIVIALRSEGLPAKAALAPPEAALAPLPREVTLAAAYCALLYVVGAAGEAAAGALFYGGGSGGPPELPPLGALTGHGPLSSVASLLLLPALFAAGQVATHVCLLFPRAERLLGTPAAAAAVGAAWAVEGAFLPLYVDARASGYRLVAAVLPATTSLLLFAAHRRVVPLLLAHWGLAVAAAVAAAFALRG
jgi:hypothetical protein